jgi:hypothetical protein
VTWTLENWSDLTGLMGSLALVVTAFRNDGLNGFVDRLRKTVENAKRAAKEDAMAPTIVKGLEEELTKWTWIDRWSLRAGAGLLVAAYLLKLMHQWMR